MNQHRFCSNCGKRTEHKIERPVDQSYNPRGRGSYRCLNCKKASSKRHLRPSAESSY